MSVSTQRVVIGALVLGALLVGSAGLASAQTACLVDTDCAMADEGHRCDMSSHNCSCTTNDDCNMGDHCFWPLCLPPSCSTDADCTNALNGPRCMGGTCGCQSDLDCTAPDACDFASQFCLPPMPCASNDDCIDRIAGHFCKVDGECGCQTDADCAMGVCKTTGICGPPGCSDDLDCVGVSHGSRCNVATRACGCMVNADCVIDARCDQTMQQCTNAPEPPCTQSSDCSSGEICVSGNCVLAAPECTADSDCAMGEACQQAHCVVIAQPDAGAPMDATMTGTVDHRSVDHPSGTDAMAVDSGNRAAHNGGSGCAFSPADGWPDGTGWAPLALLLLALLISGSRGSRFATRHPTSLRRPR